MIWVLLAGVVLAGLYWLFISPYSQIFGRFPYEQTTQNKQVALTFDDGPNEPYTSQVLHTLNEYKIKATFFIVGKNANKYPEVVKRIYKEGHTVGNHSYSHAFYKNFTEPNFRREISQTQDILFKIIGQKPHLFRPPWLWRTPLLFRTLKAQGLRPISGEFGSSLEALQPQAKTIVRHTLNKVRPGSIIIFHDGYDAKGGNRSQTVKAIELLAVSLISQGYKFVTVDELLGLMPYKE